jgi:hypothetical protein
VTVDPYIGRTRSARIRWPLTLCGRTGCATSGCAHERTLLAAQVRLELGGERMQRLVEADPAAAWQPEVRQLTPPRIVDLVEVDAGSSQR